MTRPKTDPPDDLTRDQKLSLRRWATERYPDLARPAELRELLDACLDWHRANGKRRSDWLATARNWVRNQARFDGIRAQQRAREKPQEARGDVIPIDKAFRDAAKRMEGS